jgi:hypothetical protein
MERERKVSPKFKGSFGNAAAAAFPKNLNFFLFIKI